MIDDYNFLNNLEPENFIVGDNFENVISGRFRINLHIHTEYSDGRFSVQELLDQAVKYAEYRRKKGYNDPLIIAITDHDTLFGTQEALKIISNNPEKYDNILFITGIEFNAYYINQEGRKKQLEVQAYCIDPVKLEGYVEKIRRTNLNYANELIAGNDKITFEYLEKHAKYIRAGGSPAFMSEILDILKRNSDIDTKKIKAEHIKKYGELSINPGTPELKDIVKAVKDSGQGFVGIAHPGRSLKGTNIDEALAEFKKIGVQAIEIYYHYIQEDGVDNDVQEHIARLADIIGLLKTGGVDCHRKSIFWGREPEPKKIPKII